MQRGERRGEVALFGGGEKVREGGERRWWRLALFKVDVAARAAGGGASRGTMRWKGVGGGGVRLAATDKARGWSDRGPTMARAGGIGRCQVAWPA
jgi:hypothetical protein